LPLWCIIAQRVVDVEEYRTVMQVMLQTSDDSYFKPWLKSLDIAYDLDDLIAKRDRIYLVALDLTDQISPMTMAIDLIWRMAVFLVGVILVCSLRWLVLLAR
jgi:hypothetical protein